MELVVHASFSLGSPFSTDPLHESFPTPPFGVPEGGTGDSSFRFPCESVQISDVFPGHLLTCEITRKSIVESTLATAGIQQRLQSEPMWFDLLLYRGKANGRRHNAELLAAARRVVEIDLTHGQPNATGSSEDQREGSADPLHDSLQSLEQFYLRSRQSSEVWAELGIGGLHTELETILRRVFLSRLPSIRSVTEALGVQPVRGLILHGRSGNGKTLIARALTKVLGKDAAEITIVHASDVLSKYVGDSEKNLERFFHPKETAPPVFDDDFEELWIQQNHSQAKNTAPKLQVLVIDELETLFVQRGQLDGSSAASLYEGVTNTLLSLMDGMESLPHDFLVVGITNRLEALDGALLRPGRFEVVINIPDPNHEALEEIFDLHTASLRQHAYLAADVDTTRIADQLVGMSGAEVAGVVRSAISLAMEKHVENAAAAPFLVTLSDFQHGIQDIASQREQSRMKSALATHESLTALPLESMRALLVDHDGTLFSNVDRITNAFETVIQSHGFLTSGAAVVQGAMGSGKSSVAKLVYQYFNTNEAKRDPNNSSATNRPQLHFIHCRRLMSIKLEDSVTTVVNKLHEITASHKIELSLVVLDDADDLFDAVEPFPTLRVTLWSAIYQYLQPTVDQIHRTMNESVEGVSGSSKRLLLLTVSRPYALKPGFQPDVLAELHSVYRSSLYHLLPHYHVVSPSDRASMLRIARSYPNSLSVSQFLRLTELALWKVEGRTKAAPLKGFHMPRTFQSSQSAFSTGGADANSDANEPPAITSQEAADAFAEAVHAVSLSMGHRGGTLLNMHRASMESDDDVAAGEGAEEVLW